MVRAVSISSGVSGVKSQAEVQQIFNKFAGREVRMKEQWHAVPSLADRFWAGNTINLSFRPYMKVRPDWTDRTFLSLLFTAKANGLKLFLDYPGHDVPRRSLWGGGQSSARDNRLWVGVDKGADGKWRLTDCYLEGALNP